jgi:uncharacterized OB-fold protein
MLAGKRVIIAYIIATIRIPVQRRRLTKTRCRRCDVPFFWLQRVCPRCGAARRNYFVVVCVVVAALAAAVSFLIETLPAILQEIQSF